MTTRIFISIALGIVWLVSTPSVSQETFRCGSALVSPGMASDEVLARCGEPDDKEVVEEPIRARNAGGGSRVIGITLVEHWTYSRGRGRFPALLRIEEGELKRVEFLERE